MILREIQERQIQAASSKNRSNAHIHRSTSWSSLFWQWFRYCLVGGANTLIDMLVLSILLWRFPTTQVQVLVIYNSLGYIAGAASSFFLNKYWTFGRKQRPTSQEVGRFLVSIALEILSSNGLLWLISNALHPFLTNTMIWGNTSKLLAVAANTVLSYLIMRLWIFSSGSPHRLKQQATIHPALSRSTRDDLTLLKQTEPVVNENLTRASVSVILPVYNEEAVIASTVATVLCCDKTGTLTANRLYVHAVQPLGTSEEELGSLLGTYAASVSASNTFAGYVRRVTRDQIADAVG